MCVWYLKGGPFSLGFRPVNKWEGCPRSGTLLYFDNVFIYLSFCDVQIDRIVHTLFISIFFFIEVELWFTGLDFNSWRWCRLRQLHFRWAICHFVALACLHVNCFGNRTSSPERFLFLSCQSLLHFTLLILMRCPNWPYLTYSYYSWSWSVCVI